MRSLGDTIANKATTCHIFPVQVSKCQWVYVYVYCSGT